jgi:hypothetical protein
MDDQLHEDIKIFLSGQLAIQFFREKGIEFMTDRYLTDFSAAWGPSGIKETELGTKIGGVGSGDINPYYGQEYLDYEKQHKDDAVSRTLSWGLEIQQDNNGNLIIVGGGRQHIEINSNNRAEFIVAINALPAPSSIPDPVTSPAAGDNQIPKHQGDNYLIQKKRNEEALEFAVKQEKKFHQTVKNWRDQG